MGKKKDGSYTCYLLKMDAFHSSWLLKLICITGYTVCNIQFDRISTPEIFPRIMRHFKSQGARLIRRLLVGSVTSLAILQGKCHLSLSKTSVLEYYKLSISNGTVG